LEQGAAEPTLMWRGKRCSLSHSYPRSGCAPRGHRFYVATYCIGVGKLAIKKPRNPFEPAP
jgi:hypothetical protein